MQLKSAFSLRSALDCPKMMPQAAVNLALLCGLNGFVRLRNDAVFARTDPLCVRSGPVRRRNDSLSARNDLGDGRNDPVRPRNDSANGRTYGGKN